MRLIVRTRPMTLSEKVAMLAMTRYSELLAANDLKLQDGYRI
tara:strand:- start:227 stop:352 length:126 start_codon:yes stop_codon:yes gene_type:complete